MKRSIRPDGFVQNPAFPFTPAVETNGLVFISGQVANVGNAPALRNTNIAEETTQVMENLGAILKAAGLGYDDLVKCTIYVSSLQYYAEVGRIYMSYFEGDVPARETIAVKELPRGANVEISAVAARS